MITSVQIIRNILGNWGSIFLGMMVGFLMMPFLIHSYGDDRYGLWILTLNFTGYLGLLNLGVGGSVVKYVAEYTSKKDIASLNEICTASFCLYLGTGILAAILSVIISFYGIVYFKIPVQLLTEAKYVVLIIGLQIAASIPLSIFSSYMRGVQRYDAIAFISICMMILRTMAIVIFVLYGFGLICLAMIHFVTSLLEGAVQIIYVYKMNDGFKIGMKFIRKKSFRMVSDYSLFFFLYIIAIRLIFAADSLLIGYFIGTAAIAFYGVAHRLTGYIRLLVMGMSVFQPTVSQLEALNQNAKYKSLMSVGTKYVMMISLPMGASYMIVGHEFLNLWIGHKYAALSYPTLVILSIGIIAFLAQHICIQVLQGLAKHNLAAYSAVLQAVISIVLIIVLMKYYGIAGTALGKTIPMIMFNLLWIPWYTCRLLKISYRKFLGEAFFPPLFAVLIFSLTLYFLSQWIAIHDMDDIFIRNVFGHGRYTYFVFFPSVFPGKSGLPDSISFALQ